MFYSFHCNYTQQLQVLHDKGKMQIITMKMIKDQILVHGPISESDMKFLKEHLAERT